MKAFADVFCAQAGANREFFNDFHRCCQTACAQQQGRLVRLCRGHAPRNLYPAATNLAADDWRRDHFSAALFKQQDGHALADIFPRHILEDARPLGIQIKVDGCFLGLAVEAGLGIRQVLAGENHLLFDDHSLAVAVKKAFRAKRDSACTGFRHAAFSAFFNHADFQRGCAPQNVLGLGGVLYARQLNHDAVLALLLDHGLCYTQFIDAVVQRGDVLLERLVLNPACGLGLDAGAQLVFSPLGAIDGLEVGKLICDQPLGRVQGCRIAKADFNGLPVAADAAVADVLFPECGAQVARQRLRLLRQRRLHVHLQHKVNTAAQVQAEVHRKRMQGCQPVR